MDWKPVVDIVVTAVFLLGIGLALWGLLTVHRSPYFSEVQKLKWLLLVLFLPYLGPLVWILRVRTERAEAAQRELEAAKRDGAPLGEAGEVAARAEQFGSNTPTPTIKVTKVTLFQLDSASHTPYSSMCCLR